MDSTTVSASDSKASSSQFFVHKNGRAPLLNSSNYKPWSVAIRHILDSVSCWEIVDGTELALPISGNGSAARQADFKKRKSIACSLLYSSCSIDLQGHINDIWEPTTIWETLSRQADESKQRGGPILLRRQLQLERFTEGSIASYVSRILSYRDRLSHTPQKLSTDEVISYILIGLPQSWSTISTVIENQPLETQTLDSVVNTLHVHERKLATQAIQPTSVTSTTPNALLAQKRKSSRPHRGRSQPSRDRDDSDTGEDDNDVECWYCLKKGHLENECRIKKRASIKKAKRQSRVNVALASADINSSGSISSIADAEIW